MTPPFPLPSLSMREVQCHKLITYSALHMSRLKGGRLYVYTYVLNLHARPDGNEGTSFKPTLTQYHCHQFDQEIIVHTSTFRLILEIISRVQWVLIKIYIGNGSNILKMPQTYQILTGKQSDCGIVELKTNIILSFRKDSLLSVSN